MFPSLDVDYLGTVLCILQEGHLEKERWGDPYREGLDYAPQNRVTAVAIKGKQIAHVTGSTTECFQWKAPTLIWINFKERVEDKNKDFFWLSH